MLSEFRLCIIAAIIKDSVRVGVIPRRERCATGGRKLSVTRGMQAVVTRNI